MEVRKRLFLLRHAEVEAAYHQTFGGTVDMNLSEFGLKQAALLVPFLKEFSLDAIYSSPMKRVQQTIEQVLPEVDHQSHQILPDLREVDFGSWTGLKWHDVIDVHGQSAFDWLKHLEQGEIKEAEPMISFEGRTRLALNTILDHPDHHHVLVACHGGVIRMILSHLLDLPLQKLQHFDVDYASITEVHVRTDINEIKLLNFRPWAENPTYSI